MGRVPGDEAELTVDWLRGVLKNHGAEGPPPESMSIETVGAGLGLAGSILRLRVPEDPANGVAARSFIAKFPPKDQQTRAIGNALHLYERESLYYDRLDAATPVRTPRCLYNGCDAAADAYLLLLEDLAPMAVGDQIAGWTLAQAEAAVDAMAALHAHWWGRVDTDELAWMPEWNGEAMVATVQYAFRQSWPAFDAKFGDALPPALRGSADAVAESLPGLMAEIGAAPRTVVHGDFRMDNLFFDEATPPEVTVIDWQIACRGRGVFDLAYFLVQSGTEEMRRRHEDSLIARYVAALAAAGVTGYGEDACRADYRVCILYSLVYPTISGGGMDLGNARGVDLIRRVTARTAAAIDDHSCLELLRAN